MSDDERFAQYARLLGMKTNEIREVQDVAGGVEVRTHDGVWTRVREDGALEHRVAPSPPVTDDPEPVVVEPNPEPEPPAEKPAPKRRSRA